VRISRFLDISSQQKKDRNSARQEGKICNGSVWVGPLRQIMRAEEQAGSLGYLFTPSRKQRNRPLARSTDMAHLGNFSAPLDRKLGTYLFGVGGDCLDVSRAQQKSKQTEVSVEHLMMARLHVQGPSALGNLVSSSVVEQKKVRPERAMTQFWQRRREKR
jgi:hypothetical protein